MRAPLLAALALLAIAGTAETGANDGIPRRRLGRVRLRNDLAVPLDCVLVQHDGILFGQIDDLAALTLEPGQVRWFRAEPRGRALARRDFDWWVRVGPPEDSYIVPMDRAPIEGGGLRGQPLRRRITTNGFGAVYLREE